MYGGMQAYEDFLLNSYLWLTLGLLFPSDIALRLRLWPLLRQSDCEFPGCWRVVSSNGIAG